MDEETDPIIRCGGESVYDFWAITCPHGEESSCGELYIFKGDETTNVFVIYRISLARLTYRADINNLVSDDIYEEIKSLGHPVSHSFEIDDVKVPAYDDSDIISRIESPNIFKRAEVMLSLANTYGPETLHNKPYVLTSKEDAEEMYNLCLRQSQEYLKASI